MTADRWAAVRQYAPTVVACCPECQSDLQHEGADGYWCAACQVSWSFAQVAIYETGDRPDD